VINILNEDFVILAAWAKQARQLLFIEGGEQKLSSKNHTA
jgi:hypothetical protein